MQWVPYRIACRFTITYSPKYKQSRAALSSPSLQKQRYEGARNDGLAMAGSDGDALQPRHRSARTPKPHSVFVGSGAYSKALSWRPRAAGGDSGERSDLAGDGFSTCARALNGEAHGTGPKTRGCCVVLTC